MSESVPCEVLLGAGVGAALASGMAVFSPALCLSVSLSCCLVAQSYLSSFPARTARVCLWSTRRGAPKNPQYTLQNEGLGMTSRVWLPPLPAQSMASGSSALGVWMGAHLCPWVCDSGSPALQMAAWLCLCLSHWPLVGAIVREGPILSHKEGWGWRTVGESSPQLVMLLTV